MGRSTYIQTYETEYYARSTFLFCVYIL